MNSLLWLIPALPLLGFLLLTTIGSRMPRSLAATIGVGSVGLSALLSVIIGVVFISNPPSGEVFTQHLWTWMEIGRFQPDIAFRLDPLSVVFVFVITFVGFLIHLYSLEFMKDDEGFSRFFAYMNLFVASMLILVLADNLLLLYLGWEGVGLCSFLLIGFWYTDPANGYAARKAFIITRVGDAAMAIGLFLLFWEMQTLNITGILENAPAVLGGNENVIMAITLLLLGGAVGKSAQLPLQTWLPDAMAGPSPVSALIHAATMVTAGVYLLARMHVLFELSPVVMHIVAAIGAATLLVAGFSAFAQRDIKRVLAYSTISQIGYMFVALGVGAWSAAVFHFMIHAFFKALLFLGAGAIIITLRHEHDMFKMGGLRKQLPVTFWTFLIASGSLAALPLITAGFYSKDMILWYSWSSELGSPALWGAGLVGAFITAVYTFRMVFLTFFGDEQQQVTHSPGWKIKVPLVILGALSLCAGFIELPHTFGNLHLFSGFTEPLLPGVPLAENVDASEWMLQLLAALASVGGVAVAYFAFYQKRERALRIQESGWARFLQRGWDFDRAYDILFVRPLVWLSAINKADFIDRIYGSIAGSAVALHRVLSYTQTGKLRWYAMGVAIGAVITLTMVTLL